MERAATAIAASLTLAVVTTLFLFIGYCFLSSYHRSFGGFTGNLSTADILIKSLPGLGPIVVVMLWLIADPTSPWHENIESLWTTPQQTARWLLKAAAGSAISAIGLGKLRAFIVRRFAKRVSVFTADKALFEVIVIALGKDFISCYDPVTENCFMLPWAKIIRIEAQPTRRRLSVTQQRQPRSRKEV